MFGYEKFNFRVDQDIFKGSQRSILDELVLLLYFKSRSLLDNVILLKFVMLNVLDIDECISNHCDKNSECIDSINSYTCKCTEGFTGNGSKCTGTNITYNA